LKPTATPEPDRDQPADGSAANLATARLLWQLGDWPALLALPAPSSAGGKLTDSGVAIQLMRMEAAFHLGALDEGQALARRLLKSGVDRGRLVAALLGGAQGCLARGWLLMQKEPRATTAMTAAVALNPEGGDAATVAPLRLERERAALEHATGLQLRTVSSKRKLFVDCGGYDGCSALMFLLDNPDFDCVSFEPNPALWDHFEGVPTRLVRKAAYVFDGEIDFKLDPIDSDGSTLIAGKRVDFSGTLADSDCPVIKVRCVDLSAFIRNAARTYDTIILKLDVEGAEYDILEHMLAEGTIDLIERLYCEFHAHKMEIEPGRHGRVVEEVARHVRIDPWDALAFSIASKDSKKRGRMRREKIVETILSRRNLLRDEASPGAA